MSSEQRAVDVKARKEMLPGGKEGSKSFAAKTGVMGIDGAEVEVEGEVMESNKGEKRLGGMTKVADCL
jgi:hypothetical protein